MRTEVVGGATTFVALSYIVFVQPAVLATTGMDAGAVLVATCLASAFATALMGLWAGYPIAVAPALIVVGSFMLRSVARVEFRDPPAAIASFLTIVTMPFAFSITDGIAFGFIVYAVLMVAAGRGVMVHPLLYLFAALFLLRYTLL